MPDPRLDIIVGMKDQASQKLGELGKGLGGFGQKASQIGRGLTAGLTTPLVGVAAAAIKFNVDLNKSMANVQSLGVAEDRVNSLKSSVQALAIDTGKATGDLADGVYNVISAFGDSEDAFKIVEINAKAAAAGLAETSDAIDLTSALTKGYGDTSALAVQQAADLAFQTVRLGQTTFPELAGSMGKVVPIAAALGVKQEVLFAQMATLTGVTGGAAEVSTQLRATFQALLKPTGDMAESISDVAYELDQQGKIASGPLVDAWKGIRERMNETTIAMGQTADGMKALEAAGHKGTPVYKELEDRMKDQQKAMKELNADYKEAAAALGPVIVQSVGTVDALKLLSDTAGGNTDTLGKMFGSVEALSAVLALSGGQADVFNEKLAAMGDVSGAADDAFKAQTEGINAAGFQMEQFKQKIIVAAQKLGDKLAPALGKILDRLLPLGDKLIAAVDWFSELDPQMQAVIGGALGIAAAIGPVLIGVGMLTGAITTLVPVITGGIGAIGAVVAILGGPLTIAIVGIVAVIGGLALAWRNNWFDIQGKTKAAWNWIKEHLDLILMALGPVGLVIAGVRKVWGENLFGIQEMTKGAANVIIGAFNAIIGAWNALSFTVPSINIPKVEIAGQTLFPGAQLGGQTFSTPDIPTIPSFAAGGVVPGPRGQAQLAVVHGKEVVTPAVAAGGAGATQVTINVAGSVLTERDLIDTVWRELKQRGLAGASLGLS